VFTQKAAGAETEHENDNGKGHDRLKGKEIYRQKILDTPGSLRPCRPGRLVIPENGGRKAFIMDPSSWRIQDRQRGDEHACHGPDHGAERPGERKNALGANAHQRATDLFCWVLSWPCHFGILEEEKKENHQDKAGNDRPEIDLLMSSPEKL